MLYKQVPDLKEVSHFFKQTEKVVVTLFNEHHLRFPIKYKTKQSILEQLQCKLNQYNQELV